jgi:hypothetical protein
MKESIKKTYICRQVDNWKLQLEIKENYQPGVGDVGVFEVLHIGKHRSIQGGSMRHVTIIEGDHIMAAFGTRYATGQFEGYVPQHVNQELHILGAGGTIGLIESMHDKYEDIGPTKLRMVGLAVDWKGNVMNTKKLVHEQMIPFSGAAASATKVILSLGSAMDSGKTTSAAYLIHGLKRSGLTVAYIKLTGTVYTKDCDLAFDLGADIVADFADYGFPSTYMCEEEELLSLYETLLVKVLPPHPDYVVIEIADGLYERETKMLLTNKRFLSTIDAVIFSAGDSLAAISGVQVLNNWNIQPTLLSGLFTAAPLLIREVKENTTVPVFTLDELAYSNKPAELFINSGARVSNQ